MKLVLIQIIIILLFSLEFQNTSAQQPVVSELRGIFSNKDTVRKDFSKPLKNSENEIDVTVSAGFLVYKTFVSSQDKPSCVFTPSCSEYAVESFKEKGPIGGWLRTFDRLSRCHGFANPKHYPLNSKKNLFYDPVQ
jgi:putative component of membrane protein insertase Oxa1/YidC/SpoIIIJ protein YidD